jgi:hypothetical protein
MGSLKKISARAMRKIKQKIGIGRLVALACERYEGLFQLLYHRLAARPDGITRRLRQFEPEVEAELERVVREVRERGIAVWPGLYAESAFLDEANRLVASLEAPVREALRCSDGEGVYDPINERTYWPNTEYRLRTFYKESESSQRPPVIDRVIREPVLCEADYRLRGTNSIYGVLAENLHPEESNQKWHFDSKKWHLDVLGDQLKAMVLLTDVESTQGPMEYKVGSHRLPLPRRWHPNQQHGTYFSPEEVAELPGELLQATGRAGDCVIFDPHGLHRGTPCVNAERKALVVYYQGGDTRRNALVNFLDS